MIVFFGTHVYQIVHMCTDDYDYISSNFFSFLEISIFGAKNDLKLPISVLLLYISGAVDHTIKILLMISTSVFSLFFLKKMQHCKY